MLLYVQKMYLSVQLRINRPLKNQKHIEIVNVICQLVNCPLFPAAIANSQFVAEIKISELDSKMKCSSPYEELKNLGM